MVNFYRQRFEHYGHGAADQAIVAPDLDLLRVCRTGAGS